MKPSSRLNSAIVAEVMTKGRAVHTDSFLMKYIENKNGIGSGFSFISSKKSFKTAVLRNKARRRGRAALQSVLKTSGISKRIPRQKSTFSFYVVFLLKPNIFKSPFEAFKGDIEQSLRKSGILNNL